MVTIREVAKQAGVSESTVSRVLNGNPHVDSETRRRVLDAVASLGYTPRSYARVMKGKPSNSVALIISDVTNPFFASLTRGVEDVVQRAGYSLVLGNADRGEEKQRQYLERVLSDGIRGVIIAPAANSLDDLRHLSRQGVALVIVDWRLPLPQADNVYTDSYRGAWELTSHLLSLGHERIAVISGPRGDATAEDRVRGYRDALVAAGQVPDESIVCFGAFTREAGHHYCQELLALEGRPTALITCNNRLAVGAFQAITEMGLRVPEDISLASFDEVPFLPALAPRLTVYAQPDYEMGRIAAELLLERLRGERDSGERREVKLQGQLLKRVSTSPCPYQGEHKPARA